MQYRYPLVSIMVPVYGVETFIRQFAESLLGQTYPNIEFIIVNDGCRDRSMDIFREVLDSNYPHLKERVHIYDKENGGLPKARMYAMERFSGDFIMFSDPDDWMEKDMVEKLMANALEHDSDIAYCDYWFEYVEKHKTVRKRELDYGNGQAGDWLEAIFDWKSRSYLWNCIYKAELIRDHEIVPPPCQMNEDTFFFCQFLEFAHRISHLKEPLYHYRLREGSIANSRERKARNRVERAHNWMTLMNLFRDRGYSLMSERVRRDIVAYAGWSILKFDRKNFGNYPEISAECRKFRVSTCQRLPFLKQLLLRGYMLCREF